MLTAALAISFAGCSSKSKETTSDTTAESATAAATVSETEASETTQAVADNTGDEYIGQYKAFVVTSESLHDGYWDDETSDTNGNPNLSPQLSWDPVEGASCYVVYMVDLSANLFLHWKQGDITETTLPKGYSERRAYVGPYPPKGSTHQYIVYVFALKAPVERVKGLLRSGFPEFPDAIKALDTDKDGNTGNILAAGKISGLFIDKAY